MFAFMLHLYTWVQRGLAWSTREGNSLSVVWQAVMGINKVREICLKAEKESTGRTETAQDVILLRWNCHPGKAPIPVLSGME